MDFYVLLRLRNQLHGMKLHSSTASCSSCQLCVVSCVGTSILLVPWEETAQSHVPTVCCVMRWHVNFIDTTRRAEAWICTCFFALVINHMGGKITAAQPLLPPADGVLCAASARKIYQYYLPKAKRHGPAHNRQLALGMCCQIHPEPTKQLGMV